MSSIKHVFFALTIVAAAVLSSGCATNNFADSGSFTACKDYVSQSQAQPAWKDAGKPTSRDKDGDGRVCENLSNSSKQQSPATSMDTDNCVHSKTIVVVRLSRSKYPETVDHLEDAIAAGQPSVLHIDRNGADENRAQSLSGIPTKPGYDRDEYSPAVSAEGGKGADVRYVTSADNRGAGSSMGSQLSSYCNGQAFKIKAKN